MKILTILHEYVAGLTILRCPGTLMESSLQFRLRMAQRVFVDRDGRSWRVWSTIPAGRSVLRSEFAAGWLTFESGDERRRLAPIPPEWESANESKLASLCRVAREASRVPRDASLTGRSALSGPERDAR